MSAYHLRKSEVEYELRIRGVPLEGSAGELRKRLAESFGKNHPVEEGAVNGLDPEAELEECEAKYGDLTSLVADYDGNGRDNEFQRLSARLWHLFYRTERIPLSATSDGNWQQRKTNLGKKVKRRLDGFLAKGAAPTSRVPEFDQEEARMPGGTSMNPSPSVDPVQHQPTGPLESRQPTGPDLESTPRYSNLPGIPSWTRTSFVPVYKWGLQFDGSSGQSIAAFLERVEELRRARGASRTELFNSAVDLFSGPALIWYRATMSRIHSWEELCKEMRIVFQTPDYDIRLQQEIFNRTQGEMEPIDLFIAAMEGLYTRLGTNVPESTRLRQIMHNLHPQLQDRLALVDIDTLDELRRMGRKAEAGRLGTLMGHPRSPPTAVEPDLAYAGRPRQGTVRTAWVASTQMTDRGPQSLVCWNCGVAGHRSAECSQRRRRFCFGCGHPDTIRRDCPKCGSKKRERWGSRSRGVANSPLVEVDPPIRTPPTNPEDNVLVSYLLDSREEDPRPYLTVRVFGRTIKALLDSGASQTIIGQEGLWILKEFPARVRATAGKCVETADARKHRVEGFVHLPITLKGRTENLVVLVVPSLPQALILGIDFWDRMHIIADVHHRKWDFALPYKQAQCCAVGGIASEDHLAEAEKKKLYALVDAHFKGEEQGLGRTDRVKHVINTGGAPAVKQRYYPISPARQKLVNEELDRMLELGVVEPSHSDWSSPILLLDKPDGSRRFCVDFRRVNAVSKKDAYPLPQVTTILDRLRDARYLSSLDIKSAYWQIPLDPASKEKTAFTIPGRGLFHFVTMPFGLSNAPATWQRFVDNVLGPELEPHVFVYLDDIVVVTPTFRQHLEVLEEIFRRIRADKITLNREKCQFCRPELKYLGYVVSEKGLRVDPDKVRAILDIPVPRNQKEVRQFCGTASWYRRFIPNFAARLYPLTCLLKRRRAFEWTKEAQEAFLDIKSCLITAPILTCPDFSKPFIISCDASGVGLGAVLSQESENGEVVVAYGSRTLSNQEQKYSTTERECLAVIWAVERFRPYVEGTRFTVITDHHSLIWLNNLKDPHGRLARWALRLQPYDFNLIHRKGQENVVPDLLSRTVQPEPGDVVPCAALQLADIQDKWYRRMMEKVAGNGEAYRQWRVQDQQLWKRTADRPRLSPQEPSWKLVLPKDLRHQALEECHDAPTAGHQGVQKTYKRMQERYYWPKMRKDVAMYVSRCKVCQSTKYDQQRPAGLMGERRGVDSPWKMISADLLGPLPRSLRGNKYLLVVMDTFTKYALLYPLRAATAKAVATRLEEDVFLVYGVPSYIICDNGSEFIGSPVKKLAQDYRVKVLLNASRHPQANPTERVNRSVVTMLRAYVGAHHRSWDQYVAQIGFALRTSVHEVTGYSPAFLNFGRDLSITGAGFEMLQAGDDVPQAEDCQQYNHRLQTIRQVYSEVTEKLKEAHKKNAHHYNLRRRPQELEVNTCVWKRNFAQSDAANFVSAKLTPRFVGPYRIKKKISPAIYALEDLRGKPMGNWHVADLKPYVE